LAVRCTVQKSRPNSDIKVKGQGHQAQKSAAFCSGAVLWGTVLMQHFFGSSPRGRSPWGPCVQCMFGKSSASSMPVGKSVHAV